MKVRITNIQRFCLNDGPGIRTTVFLKGCNLRCPWCANPENIKYEKQEYIKDNKKGIFGRDILVDELFNELIKDSEYYFKSGGGVTFSGGEPLLQYNDLLPLLKKLKENNINIVVESAMMVPSKFLKAIISYVDQFIVDVKVLDEEMALEKIGGYSLDYYENLDLLFTNNKVVTFRVPLVKNYTIEATNMEKIIELLKKYKGSKVEVFKIHNLAGSKYKSLGMEMPKFDNISDEEIESICEVFRNNSIDVEVIKI